MTKKTYERLFMDVTEFDVEDVITTSGEVVDPTYDPTNDFEGDVIGAGGAAPGGI